MKKRNVGYIPPSNQCTKVSQLWPQPHITEAVASKVRIVNNTNEPRTIRRHEHLSQVHLTTGVDSTPALAVPPPPPPPRCHSGNPVHQSGFFFDAVTVDPDNILPDSLRSQFRQLLQAHDDVFNPTIVGYNGAAGPVEATVNVGPVQPPQRKGRVPQYKFPATSW